MAFWIDFVVFSAMNAVDLILDHVLSVWHLKNSIN